MPDQLKVFVDQVITGVDFIGGDTFPIVSNDATTQAAVKDIKVGTTTDLLKTGDTVLKAGDLVAGTTVLLNELSTMTGLEIIDVNESLSFKLDVPITPYDFSYPVGSAVEPLAVPVATSITSFKSAVRTYDQPVNDVIISGGAAELATYNTYKTDVVVSDGSLETLVDETVYTTPTMTQPGWVISTDETVIHYRYDGNNITHVSAAPIVDGVVGTWSSKASAGYTAAAYNTTDGKVYFVDATAMYSVSLASGASEARTNESINGWVTGTTFCRAAAVGDFYFRNQSSASNLQVARLSTKTLLSAISITGFSPVPNGALAAVKTATHYVVFQSDAGVLRKYAISIADLEALDFTALTFTDTNQDEVCHNSYAPMGGNDAGYLFYRTGANEISRVKVEHNMTFAQMGGPEVVYTGTLYASSGVQAPAMRSTEYAAPTPGSVAASDININIPCRVSGVEVTGV